MRGKTRDVHGLLAEAVKGAALAFKGVYDVHGSNSLALGMFGVGDGVADDIFEEGLEYAAGLFIDKAADTLHTASPC